MRTVPSYRITHLGYLPECNYTVANGINNRGQVVGYSLSSLFPSHGELMFAKAFVWENGNMTPLRAFDEAFSHAYGINDRGEIVGDARAKGGVGWWPALWLAPDRAPLRLPGPAGAMATALNAHRSIVGHCFADTDEPEGTPLHWHAASAPRIVRDRLRLPKKISGPHFTPTGINDHGDLIGYSHVSKRSFHITYEEKQRAWLYRRKRWIALPPDGDPKVIESECHAINNAGVAVGRVRLADEWLPYIWKDGNAVALDLAGNTSGEAKAINAQGDIVGELWKPKQVTAALWKDGRAILLNEAIAPGSGWELYEAVGINDRGQIIGRGLFRGESRENAFLLTPR